MVGYGPPADLGFGEHIFISAFGHEDVVQYQIKNTQHDFFSQFSRVQMSSGQEKQMVMCVDVFLMDSPSWPWQISVVPVVPSTNTAFSLISLRDGARGGQREHTTTRSQSRSSHTDVLSFPPCASYPDALSLPFSISRVLS